MQELERMENVTVTCIIHWKQGSDAECYEAFIRIIEHLEFMVDSHFDRFMERKEQLVTFIQELYQYVSNKDIVGIIDLLEYEFRPFISEWRQDEMIKHSPPNKG